MIYLLIYLIGAAIGTILGVKVIDRTLAKYTALSTLPKSSRTIAIILFGALWPIMLIILIVRYFHSKGKEEE